MEVTIHTLITAATFWVLGAAIAFPLLIINGRVAPALQLMDWPKARGVARVQIPILGYSLVLLGLAGIAILTHLNYFSPWFLLTATLIALMGHLDDRSPLSPREKFLCQLACATTVVFLDPNLEGAINLRYGVFGGFLAIVFIVGVMNAINFIDGIDGLAGLVIMLASLGAGLYALPIQNFTSYFSFTVFLIGALTPFMYLNIFRRRGFMGNIGSYFFGYTLAVLHLSLPIPAPDAISRLSLSGLSIIVPLADAVMVICSRSLTFRSPFRPDKGHLHHRLIQSSIPLRWVLVTFGIIGLAGLIVGTVIQWNPLLQNSYLPFFVACSHIFIAAALIILLEKASKWRTQGYFKRLDADQSVYFFKYQLKTQDGSPVGFLRLKRLEARLSSEIRVVDLCFSEEPDTLMVVLKSLREPLKRISSRFEPHFHSEGLQATLLLEEGEFVKVASKREVSKINPPVKKLPKSQQQSA